jgi:hypothetical protein
VRAGFWWGNLRERDHLEDLGIGGGLILKRILSKCNWRVWTASDSGYGSWLAVVSTVMNLQVTYNMGSLSDKLKDWCVFRTDRPLAYSWFDRHNSPRLITNLNLWDFRNSRILWYSYACTNCSNSSIYQQMHCVGI